VRAEALLNQSGMYNVAVNFPITSEPGTPRIHVPRSSCRGPGRSIADIVMSPVFLDFRHHHRALGAARNPMHLLSWLMRGYPYRPTTRDAMYPKAERTRDRTVGPYLPEPAWPATLPTQAAIYNSQASAFVNLPPRSRRRHPAEPDPRRDGIRPGGADSGRLYMYVTCPKTGFWIVKPTSRRTQGNWGYQTNPTIGGGSRSCFFWWVRVNLFLPFLTLFRSDWCETLDLCCPQTHPPSSNADRPDVSCLRT